MIRDSISISIIISIVVLARAYSKTCGKGGGHYSTGRGADSPIQLAWCAVLRVPIISNSTSESQNR